MRKSILAANAACNAVVDLIDQGSTWSSGRLGLYNDGSSLISALPFSIPAFQDATDGTSMSNFINDATAVMDGTVSWFSVMNRDGTSIWTGTITGLYGYGDMKLNSVVFPVDTTVSISSALYMVPR